MAYNLAPLQNLIDQFERMQGIGHKTAQRMAFYVLGLSDAEAQSFAKAMTSFVRFANQTRGTRALFALLKTQETSPQSRELTITTERITCFTVQSRLWTISVPTKSG